MLSYEIFNVNCSNCVNTIKKELEGKFFDISFSDDLKIITLKECDYDDLASSLEELGFKLGKQIL